MDNPSLRGYTSRMGETKAEKLTIHIDGNTSPESIGAGELGELLQAIEASILSIAKRQSSDALPDQKLSLVSIESGSVSLAFASPAPFIPAVQMLGSRLASGDLTDLPEACRRAVIKIGKWCRDRALTIDYRLAERTIASVSPALDLRLEAAPRLKGQTALTGRVHSVGGERPAFKLRLANGELQACSCSEELARIAGKQLYRSIEVEGFAETNMSTGQAASFEAVALKPIEHKVTDAVNSIRERFGEYFDAIDVDEFMNEMRGD
jgi:hypothetical protein